jgi:hypothetical protein
MNVAREATETHPPSAKGAKHLTNACYLPDLWLFLGSLSRRILEGRRGRFVTAIMLAWSRLVRIGVDALPAWLTDMRIYFRYASGKRSADGAISVSY